MLNLDQNRVWNCRKYKSSYGCNFHITTSGLHWALNRSWTSTIDANGFVCGAYSSSTLASNYNFNSRYLFFTWIFVPKMYCALNVSIQRPGNDQPNANILCVFSMAMTIQILLSLDRVDLARYEIKHVTNNAVDSVETCRKHQITLGLCLYNETFQTRIQAIVFKLGLL